jgi:hypothetical protein
MQYDNSDCTPSMAFNVFASYASAWKFNNRQTTAITARTITLFLPSRVDYPTLQVRQPLSECDPRGSASLNYGDPPVCPPMIFPRGIFGGIIAPFRTTAKIAF